LRDADVLGFVDDGEVEGRDGTGGETGGELGEQGGRSDEAAGGEGGAYRGEDLPERGALGFGEPGAAAEAGNVAIAFPGVELPGIDHVFPFSEQEAGCEFVVRGGAARIGG
jgi:hypothetical protein